MTASLLGVRVAGTGSYLPKWAVTNDDLSPTLDTNDEWIRTRTGISTRHWGTDEEACSDFAIPACRAAMEAAEVAPEEIDLVVCATFTSDYTMPTTAALIQRELGLSNAGGFDLNSACSGFVVGLSTVANFVRTGSSKCALLVGAEKMSAVTDPQDRSTRVIFGDGAGAVILKPCEDHSSDLLAARRGLRGDDEVLVIKSSGSRLPPSTVTLSERKQYVAMEGRKTFKFAVRTFVSLIKETCADASVKASELKAIIPHQVNMRILESACERADVSIDLCEVNISRVGNTSAASVAIALDEAARAGKLERGDLILLLAFGAGLSWGSALLRW